MVSFWPFQKTEFSYLKTEDVPRGTGKEVSSDIILGRFGSAQQPGDITYEAGRFISTPLNDRNEVVYKIVVCRFDSAQRPRNITNEEGRVVSATLNDRNEGFLRL